MFSEEKARAWYPENDPVHGFDHIQRVLRLANEIGKELNADLDILSAAALLHDSARVDPGEDLGTHKHEQDAASFARSFLFEEGWAEEKIRAVQHCITAHRFRGEQTPETLEAKILFDADKLDVLGAFGAARTIGYAVQAGQPIFAEPSKEFLSSGLTQRGEPHSAYHEYLFKLQNIHKNLHTDPAKRMAKQRHQVLVQFFEQLAAEARSEA